MDPIDRQLRTYYEAEAERGLRPAHGDRRLAVCEAFAATLTAEGRDTVLDVGSGPANDHGQFAASSIEYVGVDLAVGNAALAAEVGRTVIAASLFNLPFVASTFPAGWSMSTFQHVSDDRIHGALDEFVRVLEPDAPVTIGLWGGRDEVVDSPSSSSGIVLPRRFFLRRHQRIRAILAEHFVVESDDTFAAGSPGWEYHVSTLRTPSDFAAT